MYVSSFQKSIADVCVCVMSLFCCSVIAVLLQLGIIEVAAADFVKSCKTIEKKTTTLKEY